MFTNYLKIALRFLLRHRGYSFLNIAGLALGLTCCLFIFQYVAFEYSFDGFNENAQTLYRANQSIIRGGEEATPTPQTGWAMGPTLAQQVPDIVRIARLHPEFDNAIVSVPTRPDITFEEELVYYTDPTFFEMFSYPLVKGAPGQVLSEPGTVVLSESTARKYFGSVDPIGQTLDVTGWISGEFRVIGIFQDVPLNSHLQFNILLPMVDLLRRGGYENPSTGWNWTNFITYVQLRGDAEQAAVEQKLTDVLMRHREEEFRQNKVRGYVTLQPLRDIHLNAEIRRPDETGVSSYGRVYFFTMIGLVTLLIALVNYVNLATARALGRAREVGVRKVVGAQRRQLIFQFLSESALTILAAFVLAAALGTALRPLVNDLAGTSLTQVVWTSPTFWAAFWATFFVATLLSGLYPAFVLSSFRPVGVLKGKASTKAAGGWLRRGLVVVQFTACIALLVGTAVVYTQLNYMRNLDLGMDIDQILTVPQPRILPEGVDQAEAVEAFTQQLGQLSMVGQIASSSALPGQGFTFATSAVRLAGADPSEEVPGVGVTIDAGFARLYGLELVAGEGFAPITVATPAGAPRPIVVNETAVAAVGIDTPENALGQELAIAGFRGRIVGVFKDFNWSSAHEHRENTIFFLGRGNEYVSLKVRTDDLPQTIATVGEIYRTHFPGNPFRYAFVDEQFAEQYRSDERFARLFTFFAGLAIFIACLGLFGLASFTASRRTKEIGVRKVHGATAPSIAFLLSKDFLKLVGIAFVVAAPLAYFGMQRWLEGFAYRIEIGPGVFLFTGVLVLLLAMLTVSTQAIKAALADPIKSLRYE